MGDDEFALVRLWKEKRGEVGPSDLSGNLIVQLGVTTEGLNRRWYVVKHWAGAHRRPEARQTSCVEMDGRQPRRPG